MLDRTGAEGMRLAKMFFDIPEYHDEGRLPAGRDPSGAAVLGPLAGIYASPFLQGFTRPSQIYEQGPRGTLAAIVVIELRDQERLPLTYTRLQLDSGMNCVWLAVDPPPPGVKKTERAYLTNLKYRAYVSHPPSSSPSCDRNGSMSPELRVVAVQNDAFRTDGSYPGVARFDTDGSGNPVLGFRCLSAFCEIGVNRGADVRTPDGLTRTNLDRVQWRTQPATTGKLGERKNIKAWHDEQTLAIRDSYFVWRPSKVRATIIPDTGAIALDSVDFEDRWVRVANISIEGTVPGGSKYARWGLRHGNNFVEFRYNRAGGKWLAQIVWDDGSAKAWRNMKRTVHHDVTVPPIVRFRWTGADDGVWAPCGNACCNASDDGS
jgi:hypothetical protein